MRLLISFDNRLFPKRAEMDLRNVILALMHLQEDKNNKDWRNHKENKI